MKKTQKRLGNKGFSLVELIVVIAIMAVLVGVLAPTLIKNVEKSRESKDVSNMDSVRGSVQTMLSDEDFYTALVGKTFTISADGTVSTTGITDPSSTKTVAGELTDTIGKVKLTSKNLKTSGALNVVISNTGKVTVYATSATASNNTATVTGVTGASACVGAQGTTFIVE
mgnify:CR=1 FL=1